MLDNALASGLSSDQFWDMTFRDLVGHHKARKGRNLDEWDRSVWVAMQLLQPHLEKGKRIDFYDLHPLRDKREMQKKHEITSKEDMMDFLTGLNKPN